VAAARRLVARGQRNTPATDRPRVGLRSLAVVVVLFAVVGPGVILAWQGADPLAGTGGSVDLEGPSSSAGPPVTSAGTKTPSAIGGGLVVVVTEDRIVASDVRSGAPRFDVDLATLGLPAPQDPPQGSTTAMPETATAVSVRAHESGVVIASAGTTVGLDRTGGLRWSHDSPRWYTIVAAADPDRVVLTGPDTHTGERVLLEVLDAGDGEVRFAERVAALIGVGEQSATVRELGPDRRIAALSLEDGTTRWSAQARDQTVP